MEVIMQVACAEQGGAFMVSKGQSDVNRKQKKKEKVTVKKKLKLLKGLSKDLSTFSGKGFSLDHHHRDLLSQVRGNMISEASEVLLKQLQQLRAEEKEMKRRRKLEKVKLRLTSFDPESSDSESHCEGKPKLEPVQRTSLEVEIEETKRIQVCMGNKCKRSGGEALMEEFQRLMGAEGGGGGAVVACKCMGKCKNGPNVRLSNSLDEAPSNPLFIGVALDDVAGIMAHFHAPPAANDFNLSPASL